MLILDASKGEKTLSQVCQENSLILSREIVNCICDAIDLDVPQILTAQIKIPEGGFLDLFMSYCSYEDALRVNMKVLVEAELYEECARAKEYADRLAFQSELTLV